MKGLTVIPLVFFGFYLICGTGADEPCKRDPLIYNNLVALYKNTGGARWNNGWNISNTDYCTWYGVECNFCYKWEGSKCVKYCNLFSSIHACSEECSKINAIQLYNNNMIGFIPDNFFEGLPDAHYLNFAQNYGLTGLLTNNTFANNTNIIAIFLFETDIFGELSFDSSCSATDIEVNKNIILYNPLKCGNLATLSATLIKQDDSSCNLPNMKYLIVNNGELNENVVSIEHCICSMTNMQRLTLGFNNYSGEIHECLGTQLTQLTMLELNNNMITKLRIGANSYRSIQIVNMASNMLYDDINSYSLFFSNASTIILSNNNLTSSHLYMIGNTFGYNVQNLYLDNNPRLTGNIMNTLIDNKGDTFIQVINRLDIRYNPSIKLVTPNRQIQLYQESGYFAQDEQANIYCPTLSLKSPKSSTNSYFELVASQVFIQSSLTFYCGY
jgi:hypothetical protein